MNYKLKCESCGHNNDYVMWWDIAKINDKFYWEKIPVQIISDDECFPYDLSDYTGFLAEKHEVDVDDIHTLMMDNIDVPAELIQAHSYGEELCGGHCPVCGEIQYI